MITAAFNRRGQPGNVMKQKNKKRKAINGWKQTTSECKKTVSQIAEITHPVRCDHYNVDVEINIS